MLRIGIISGLKRELRCLGLGPNCPPHVLTFAAAGSAVRARARALGWIAGGHVQALMSFGLCGGLDPTLDPGTVLVAHRIVLPDRRELGFDASWAHAIAARIEGARVEPLLGVETVAATAVQKRALFVRHAVPALDMESRGVAEAAREANIPFVALRAIADPAARSLPHIATHAINAHGRLRPFRVMLGLLRRPRELAALLALAGDARAGYDALTSAGARALRPELVPAGAFAAEAIAARSRHLVPLES